MRPSAAAAPLTTPVRVLLRQAAASSCSTLTRSPTPPSAARKRLLLSSSTRPSLCSVVVLHRPIGPSPAVGLGPQSSLPIDHPLRMMERRQWMYKGRPSPGKMTEEWKEKTKKFIDRAFELDKRPNGTLCPCSKCRNEKRVSKDTMSQHLVVHGFTPFYHTWEFHGEKPSKRAREKQAEQSTQILGTGEFDAGMDNCIDDANAPENPAVEETHEKPDQSPKKFYDTLFGAQQPLHPHAEVTQLDAIARLMSLKCNLNLSRDAFDDLLTIVASLLPQGHILPKNMYESNKILKSLKLPSAGSKNVPVCSSSNLHESPATPTTASQPQPPPQALTSIIRRAP